MVKKQILFKNEILHLPVDVIKPNPYQPRKFFERAQLEELSRSIREYGVMQPISVRLINGCTYELVAGERRLRASKMAGLLTIPVVLVKINDQDSAILAIIENLQRENLNFLEEAEGFQNLIEDYGFTQEELAEKVGKTQSTIANKIRILRLSKQVHKKLMEYDLSERHARALLRLLTEKEQLEVIEKVGKESLTVKKTEELIEFILNKSHMVPNKKREIKIKRCVKDLRIFTNTIKSAVDIMNKSGVLTEYFIEENGVSCEIKIKVIY